MMRTRSLDSLDAIKMAIQSKIDMRNYYVEASKLVRNDDATAILNGLAEKEETNRLKLIRLYSKLSGKKILYLNLGRKHKLNTLVKIVDDPNDAVRNAKKNESEIKNFYAAVSQSLYDEALKKFFRQMAMEEEQHLALLESSFEEPLNLHFEGDRKNDFTEFATESSKSAKSW